MSNRRRPRNPVPSAGTPAGVLDEDFFSACSSMVPRLGAKTLELRFSDDGADADSPTVWMAIAGFGGRRFEVGAASHPEKALFRLLEQLVDGGQCRHCARPTGITRDFTEQPAEQVVCWYQYDPELKVFRRGCA